MAPPSTMTPSGGRPVALQAGNRSVSGNSSQLLRGENPVTSNKPTPPVRMRDAAFRNRVISSSTPSAQSIATALDGTAKKPSILEAIKNMIAMNGRSLPQDQ